MSSSSSGGGRGGGGTPLDPAAIEATCKQSGVSPQHTHGPEAAADLRWTESQSEAEQWRS